MPTRGLSLVGLADQAIGVNQLAAACVPKDISTDALIKEWQAARAKAKPGIPPVKNPGLPDIQEPDFEFQAHIAALVAANPLLLTQMQSGASFKMVEIERLLAFQFAIDLPRSENHCGRFSSPPSSHELLNACLPLQATPVAMELLQQGQSILIKSKSLNIRLQQQGLIGQNAAGIIFGMSQAYALVTRYNGRCYLSNGFHRAYGARKAGATHIPCMFLDVTSHLQTGMRDDGSTLPLTLMESSDPPTLAHFTKRRAYPVRVKRMSRVLHVSWCEYAVPDE